MKPDCRLNIVRAFGQLPAPAERFAGRSGPLRVLVVGGSLGASALNTVVPAAVAQLAGQQQFELYHQTGRADAVAVAVPV